MVHLQTDGPQPIEYTKYLLMREFGWTPAELAAIPLPEILTIFTCQRIKADHDALQ